jgi:chemotaxis protein MotB
MAKFTAIEDDIGKPGKPAKPPKHRRFPWRLWLWAMVMTAAAGAGGYFAWSFRGEAEAATDTRNEAQTKKTEIEHTLAVTQKDLGSCVEKRDELTQTGATCAKERDMLAKDIGARKEELTQLRAQAEETRKRMAQIEEIQTQFAKMIDTGALKVTSRNGNLVLSLPAEVLFPSGVADLSEDGKIKVLEVGFHLKKFADRRFLVIGHSDNQPLKSATYKDNWDLSAARALTVTRYLVQAGMSSKNLLPAGAGEHDPIAPNTSAKELARNRRIEIALLPAIDELPPLPGLDKPDKPEPKK